MDLRELIEAGTAKAGEQKELARIIRINPNDLTNAKAGRRGLPAPSCFLLAQYLGIDPARVIAASELTTEKNEERRKVFYPFVMGRAAIVFFCALLVSATALPPESHAAQARMTNAYSPNWHYVNRLRRILQRLLGTGTIHHFYRWLMMRRYVFATI